MIFSCTAATCAILDELQNIKCADVDEKEHNRNALLCYGDYPLNINCIKMIIQEKSAQCLIWK